MKSIMKSEIKVEFSNKSILTDIIQKAYFGDGQMGKLSGKKNYIEVTPELDDVFHTIVRGLHNATIKITNEEIIDGSFRFIINEEDGSVKLYPISIYCVFDDSQKYSFY